MTDYFVLFDLPRLPWIEAQIVKERFVDLCAKVHPDHYHEEISEIRLEADSRFKEINSAFACLRDPKSRIQHFIELETGHLPQEIQEIPHNTTALFLEVGQLCGDVDRHLKTQERIVSPLIRVKGFAQNMDWVDKINSMLRKLEDWRNELHGQLKDMNEDWNHSSSNNRLQLLTELECCYRLLSYELRWSSQLRERLFRLSTLV